MSVPREILKWILGLDLSYPVKLPKRDFANGFLFAEILNRFYPSDVQMHSFENVASIERKRANWTVLERFFKRKGMQVDRPLVNAVIAAEGDASIEVLQLIYNFIQSPAYEQTKNPEARYSPERLEVLAQPRSCDRDRDASASNAKDPSEEVHQQYMQQYGNFGAPAGNGYPMMPLGARGEQHQMQAQMMLQQQQQQAYYASLTPPQQQYFSSLAPQQQQYMLYQAYYGQQQQAYQGQASSVAPGQASTSAATAAGPHYVSPRQPQYAGPYPPVQQQEGPARGSILNVPTSNARFKSPLRTGSSQVGVAAAATSDGYSQVPSGGAGAFGPAGAVPGYTQSAQQALLAQMQAAQAQQMQAQMQEQYAQLLEAPQTSVIVAQTREGLPFSKKPRAVEYQPYDLKDYEDKEYNIKKEGKSYWQLGRLGPDLETQELQAKREKAEKVKQMAAQVREENLKRAAAAKPLPKILKEPTARERALEFAKNVPKPEIMIAPPPPKPEARRKPAVATAGYAAVGKAATAVPAGGANAVAGGLSDLESLEAKHKQDQEKVDRIRADLARMMH